MPYDPPTMNAKNGTAFVRKWCPRRARLMTRVPARAAKCPTTGGVVLTRASAERRRARRDRAPRSFESVTDELSIHFYGQLSVNPRSNPVGVNFF